MATDYSKIFFFTKQIERILIQPFGWAFVMAFVFWVPFLRVWWWVFAPVVLAIELRTLYLWWMNWDYNYATKRKWAVLELVPPKAVLMPLKAMEDVFTVMWAALQTPPNWRENYCEGEVKDINSWMSWEIASIEGHLHFYVRVASSQRPTLETALYGHYPELEIREVPDYARTVPQSMPNEEWDVYGEDFIAAKEAPLPIKTFEKFFEPQGEKIAAEEKRIDPIASLLELMSRLGPGEQFWLQFITMGSEELEYEKLAKKIINKRSNRPEKKVKTFTDDIKEVVYNLVMGPQKSGEGEKATYKWMTLSGPEETDDRELVLSPGERVDLTDIENKVKKPVFRTNIRGVYVARRENFSSANKVLARSYFSHFGTPNLNYIKFSVITRPKTQYIFRKRIPFLRTRRQFRNYVMRFPPFFPERRQETSLFNSEEMATMYHFPFKVTGLVSPTMARVESKKGGPPPNLPIE